MTTPDFPTTDGVREGEDDSHFTRSDGAKAFVPTGGDAVAGRATKRNAITTPAYDQARALVRAIAMDIGKEVVHHIETMYPNAAKQLPGSGKLSIRNTVHNEIIAAIEVTDEGQIVARLRERKESRRKIKRAYSKIRESDDPTAPPQVGTTPASETPPAKTENTP